ncbi:MAG: DUF3883 domain-containing protein [Acidobacteria bacterium]|nr:MAG: DUF3883 domain-containing protein [Acidobacteriota bacterium]
MNKTQVVQAVSQRLGITKKHAKSICDGVQTTVLAILMRDEIASIPDFGDFEAEPRTGGRARRKRAKPSGRLFVDELAQELSISTTQADNLQAWVKVIQAALKRGERVTLTGFGTFGGNSPSAPTMASLKAKASGQGIKLNPKEKKAVDERAMDAARKHLESRFPGCLVEDVSKRKPYDFLCTPAGQTELKVEVKGTTTGGQAVTLTAGEVKAANRFYPHTALIVVSQISLDKNSDPPVAQGGRLRFHHPWRPSPSDLKPLQFKYTVPGLVRTPKPNRPDLPIR